MRIKNSIINVITGFGNQLVIAVLSLLSRRVLLDSIGVEYIGINGLFYNIISVLSLAESGIGMAITYKLYKPIIDDDKAKIIALMQVYSKAYKIIAAIITCIGLLIMPFLKFIMKNNTISNTNIIYIIVLVSTVSSYFFSYKMAILNADQKKFIITIISTATYFFATILKIAILIIFKDYILFLITDFIVNLTSNIIMSKIVDKSYPFLKTKKKYDIDDATKHDIIKDIKALIFHKIGSYFVFGTDNILISAFVSVSAVGLYSNYTAIIGLAGGFISNIFDNLIASMGNLIAKESKDKVYDIFKVLMLIDFWLYGFCSVSLLCLIEPFIAFWLGKQYIMSKSILYIIIINFYITGMRASISTPKIAGGVFFQDRYAPLVESVINLIASLIFVNWLGIKGVLIGTLISTLCVPFWVSPYFVYRDIFNVSLKKYYKDYSHYTILTIIAGTFTVAISNFLFGNLTFSHFIFRGIICLIIPNILFYTFTYKRKEFLYIKNICKILLPRLSVVKKIKSIANGYSTPTE